MESVTSVGVLDKAIGLLREIESGGPRSLLDLQAATKLPRATLHRLAVALEAHGLLRRDPAGRFCLGLDLIGLGTAAADAFPIAGLARPVLAELCQRTGESVQLYVREGEQRRCAVSFPSTQGLRWMVDEGALFPLHLGSAGHVLLGQVGKHGWVESVEERERGVASVSAPIGAPNAGVLAAVSVGGPIDRLSRQPGKRFGADVVAAAASISDSL